MIGKLILIIGIIVMLLFSIGIPNLFILEGIATIIVVVVIAVANNLETKADRPIKIVVLGPSNSGKTFFWQVCFIDYLQQEIILVLFSPSTKEKSEIW